MPHAQALATLILDAPSREFWTRYYAPSWQAYAAQHGYDIVVYDFPLDDSPRARRRWPAWQKYLMPGDARLAGYRQVVLLDASVLISASSVPPIAPLVPADRIGGVLCGDCVLDDLKPVLFERLALASRPADGGSSGQATVQGDCPDLRGEARENGTVPFGGQWGSLIDSGVLVVSPARHAALLAAIYNADGFGADDLAAEQAISRSVLGLGRFQRLNSRFNTNFYHRALVQHWHLYHGPHAADPGLLRLAMAVELENSFFLNLANQWELAALLDIV